MSLLWMFEFLDLRITSLGGGVHKSEMFGANTRTKVGTLWTIGDISDKLNFAIGYQTLEDGINELSCFCLNNSVVV